MRKNNKRDGNKTYHFSVEGYTEKWYLEWLQSMINTELQNGSVKFDCPRAKDPLSHAKSKSLLYNTKIYHIFDYESSEPVHIEQFRTTLDRMKEAEKSKSIKYCLGYSNFTFELWIILHMADCNGQLSHRRQYLKYLNDAYEENFEDLHQYWTVKSFLPINGNKKQMKKYTKKDSQSSDFIISLSYTTKRTKPLKGYLDGIIAELAAVGKSYVDIYE